MAHLSLYRKYRSQDFNTLIGQEHIIQTLKNAIQNKRLAHAYIFSGPRGTGKTSMARILAKAMNCRQGVSVDPCQECDLCQSITAGQSVDVLEIDAASNRGIDEIRKLRENVNFMPAEGEYKIYIIDEVHMLTNEAFNALLKTLEEPPAHTIFVLATTEPQKIPITIISRCQRLDFKRIPAVEIAAHVSKIAGLEKVTIDDKSLKYISKLADGSMRDALSFLDQLISFRGSDLKYEDILSLLGSSDFPALNKFVELLFKKNVQEIIAYTEELMMSGKNIVQLNKDLVGYLRNLLMAKLNVLEVIDLSEDLIASLQKQSETISLSDIKKMMDIFVRAETEMKWQTNVRMIFELAIIESCLAEGKEQVTPIVIKEKQVPVTDNAKKEKTNINFTKKEKLKGEPVKAETIDAQLEAAVDQGTENNKEITMIDVKHYWQDILNRVKDQKPATFVLLCECWPGKIDNGRLTLVFKNNYSFHKEKLMQEHNRAIIKDILKDVFKYELDLDTCLEKDFEGEAKPAVSNEAGEPKEPATNSEKIAKVFNGTVLKE